MSAKFVPRTASIERSVSVPTEASPTTVPAARWTDNSAGDGVIQERRISHAVEPAAAINEVVAAIALEEFYTGDVAAQ